MTYKFTELARQAIEYANRITLKLGHEYIGTEHMLYGLAKVDTSVASKVLEEQNVNTDNILIKIEEIIGAVEKKSKKILGFTPRMKKVLENASLEAKKVHSEYIGTEHILIGIMKEGDSIATRILINLNADLKAMYDDVLKLISENVSEENKVKNKTDKINNDNSSFSQTPTLNQFGVDLTKNAKERKNRSNNWKKC